MPKRVPATAAKEANPKPDPIPARDRTAANAASAKIKALQSFHDAPSGAVLTTDQGVGVLHTDDSLKAGLRGPTLMDDFHLREKTTHFDHERIPERVAHARGSAAHGMFRVYESLEKYTSARLLCEPRRETPVFVRFSTVVGSRGSADTARDVRGFATKFYTQERNFDLVGNNMPVFYTHFPEPVDGVKTRERSDRFLDHSSQATLFLHSLSAIERQHLMDACRFEIDPKLAEDVSVAIGVAVPKSFPVPPSGTRAATHRGGQRRHQRGAFAQSGEPAEDVHQDAQSGRARRRWLRRRARHRTASKEPRRAARQHRRSTVRRRSVPALQDARRCGRGRRATGSG